MELNVSCDSGIPLSNRIRRSNCNEMSNIYMTFQVKITQNFFKDMGLVLGLLKTSPRTSSIEQIIFYVRSFEIRSAG